MKNFPRNTGLFALGLTLALAPLSASASTISLGSFVGSSAPGLANGVITFDDSASGDPTSPATGDAVAYYNSAYAPPFAGTSFISYSPDGGGGYGITYYTTTFTGDFAGATGTLSYLVDNDLGITLNGNVVLPQGTTTTFPAFQSYSNVVSLPTGDFVDGTNTLVFGVFNSGGPTALDFSATVSPTPEPGSLVLLGTGILGLAGAARRRITR